MTPVSGGGSDAPAYTVWRCLKCNAYMRTALPCTEVAHRCPKTKSNESMKGEIN